MLLDARRSLDRHGPEGAHKPRLDIEGGESGLWIGGRQDFSMVRRAGQGRRLAARRSRRHHESGDEGFPIVDGRDFSSLPRAL